MQPPIDTSEQSATAASRRLGRAPATTHGQLSHIALQLFVERGYDETTIDDIVRAAGIGRRTFFRYFASKNELPWGDFGELLAAMRATLEATGDDVPIIDALRHAVLQFNDYPVSERAMHLDRMSLIFSVPSLMAYSSLKYADWRAVIAEYVARRRGEAPTDLTPQAIAWACLGLCLASYERWLASPDTGLLTLIEDAFATAEHIFGLAEH